MRYLTLSEALELHDRVIAQYGGALGLRDLGALESALAQPRMTFGQRPISVYCGEGGSDWLFAYPEPPILRRKQTDRPCSDGGFSGSSETGQTKRFAGWEMGESGGSFVRRRRSFNTRSTCGD